MPKPPYVGQTVTFVDGDGQLRTGPVLTTYPYAIATIVLVRDIASNQDVVLNVDEADFAVIPS